MSNATLFVNATLCIDGALGKGGWLLVEGRQIAALGGGNPPEPPAAERIDAQGLVLAPGLIDVHVHGALGYDTMDATPEALQQMARFYARHGVTAFLATTMTESQAAIMAALRNVAEVMATGTGGATLLGAHVEGPYLDVEKRGCQDAALVRTARPEEYRPLLDTGVVRLLTLAPEFAENRALISYARTRAVAVSLGHTRATYDEVCQAVALGVSQVTHLFNGMEPLHHRTPGAVGAALALDALYCQLIADNIHIHPAVLKLAVRAKGIGRVILVTDAMAGTGMPDGDYVLGGLAVTVRGGISRLADPSGAGALAGSTLTLERAVGNMMAAADLSLCDALAMATATPAQALGLAHKGALAVGMDADLVLLDAQANVRLTMAEGQIVFDGR